ncbi:hypothetical protein M408DRAFT_11440 [Serendipita vermifera MAFF 305830]|uniref:HMG box domain-containing protein n=1 Tax=Serendipita vermifera MAFF 305830 TaxID=933852 RepID=A0A0C2WB60_SERVB|nr:hypothetical protein M408DRAFT_11440 [Serendipita vermifera MAFF 305830]
MPRCSPISKSPKGTAARPTTQSVDEVSSKFSRLTITRKETTEPSLWFLPHDLGLPPRNQVGASHTRRPSATHIPRPRNPFILFRSQLLSQRAIPTQYVSFCADSRQISRIVSYVWKALPTHEKERFYQLSEEEKRLHQLRYPSYNPPLSSSTNSAARAAAAASHLSDAERFLLGSDAHICNQIGALIMQGVKGDALILKVMDIVGDVEVTLPQPTPVSSPRRKAPVKDEDAAFGEMVHARKPSKARVQEPRTPSKPRSSSSQTSPRKSSAGVRTKKASRRSNVASYAEAEVDEVDEDVAYSPSELIQKSTSTPSVTSESASLPAGRASPFVGGHPEWSMDVADYQPAFDQDDSFGPFEDSFDSMWDEAEYYEYASQYHENIHFPQAAYTTYDSEDATLMMVDHEFYINESARGLYEEF